MTVEVVELGQADAERLTERIRNRIRTMQESIDRLGELMAEAYIGRVWLPLGYESWEAYTVAEFGTDSLRLDRNERREMVVQLRSAGMSTRAIAPAVGADQSTVVRDLQTTDAVASVELPQRVTSLDGHERPATRPPVELPPRVEHVVEPQPEVDDEIVEAELVDEPEPEPVQKPRAPRTDVVAVVNRVLIKAADAAEAAEQIKREHLRSRSEEAAQWSRGLTTHIQALQRLVDLLTEMK